MLLQGRTALHVAVDKDYVDRYTVKILLENGCKHEKDLEVKHLEVKQKLLLKSFSFKNWSAAKQRIHFTSRSILSK